LLPCAQPPRSLLQDKWKGLGIFFDTFQNLDISHHHKHPYIYAMTNDGTQAYIPDKDVETDGSDSRGGYGRGLSGSSKGTSGQALPGAVDNSGCSFEFRYHEGREDVSVLNHTRVHMTYRERTLKLRLQQTSAGVEKDWFQCFEMKDVDLPSAGYFGISSATGDLVDNHDIIQFVVRPLTGVADPEADYESWSDGEKQEARHRLEEFDLRPAEALQRDYQRVLRAQAQAIKSLSGEVREPRRRPPALPAPPAALPAPPAAPLVARAAVRTVASALYLPCTFPVPSLYLP